MLEIVNHTGPRRLARYQATYRAGHIRRPGRAGGRGPMMTSGQRPAMVRTAAAIPPVFLVRCLPTALVARAYLRPRPVQELEYRCVTRLTTTHCERGRGRAIGAIRSRADVGR